MVVVVFGFLSSSVFAFRRDFVLGCSSTVFDHGSDRRRRGGLDDDDGAVLVLAGGVGAGVGVIFGGFSDVAVLLDAVPTLGVVVSLEGVLVPLVVEGCCLLGA